MITAAAYTKHSRSVEDEHFRLPGWCPGLVHLSVTVGGVVCPGFPEYCFPCPLGAKYLGGRTVSCLCGPKKSLGSGVHVWARPKAAQRGLGKLNLMLEPPPTKRKPDCGLNLTRLTAR